MIESQFEDSEGAESVRFSHSYFGFVVQTLNHATGEQLMSSKVIEDEFAVLAQRPCDFLHRLDAGTHGLATPLIEELAGPGWGVVFPQPLEVFLEKIGADGFQVEAEQVTETEFLLAGEIPFALEQAPAGFLQDGLIAGLGHAAVLGGADLVEGLVHFGDDVKAIQDVKGLGALFADDAQVGLPHVRADELNLGSQVWSNEGEESLKRFDGPLFADPQQPRHPSVDLVDQCQILVAFGVLDLVHADRPDGRQRAMLQSPLHDILDSVTDFVPRGMKGVGGLFPGKLARPAGEKQHVGFGHLVLAIAPRNLFHHHAAASAVHAPHAVQEENQNAPARNELKASLRKMVVTGSWLVAARADSRRASARPDDDFQGVVVLDEAGALVDESPETIAAV